MSSDEDDELPSVSAEVKPVISKPNLVRDKSQLLAAGVITTHTQLVRLLLQNKNKQQWKG